MAIDSDEAAAPGFGAVSSREFKSLGEGPWGRA